MRKRFSKTVYLVEILNGGHREAFMQLFAKALLESGHRVVCIKPDTALIENWVTQHCPMYSQNIFYQEVPYPRESLQQPSTWGKVRSHIAVWHYYKKHIQKISQKIEWPADLVFFNCIDGIITNYLPHQLIDLIFTYKWSGLYFHPNHLRLFIDIFKHTTGFSDVDYIFRARHCLAVAIHDEGVVSGFTKRLNGKKVLLFPEIADITPPDKNHQIAIDIREKAAGRTVIGMIGLEPFKGSYEMMRLARVADPSKYFFAFCGSFSDKLYPHFASEDQAREFRSFKEGLQENCYWNNQILAEGTEYNSVFNAFDIIFLVYRNFYSSSNRLTKAANFHKLVMSGDKYCVGEDVARYNLGETVINSDPATMLEALDKLAERLQRKDLPYKNWELYSHKNSEAVLKDKFREILELL